MDVHDPVAPPLDELGREQLHVAGEDDQVDLVFGEPFRRSRASRSSREPKPSRGKHSAAMPASVARSSAIAPGLSEATATTSIPSSPCTVSRIAWRFVPVPDASTATRKGLPELKMPTTYPYACDELTPVRCRLP